MWLLEPFKAFVVEAANLVNTGNAAALLGLLVLLMLLADHAWKRSPTMKHCSLRADAVALCVLWMLDNFGQFEGGFIAHNDELLTADI